MRFTPLLFALALLAGCASRPGYDEKVTQLYRTGTTRDQMHAAIGEGGLLSSVSRPASGWSATDNNNHQASRAAFYFEREHPGTTVQSCEVYWVGRHTSAPLVAGGVWWDYLFYDAQDTLVGYHRRFLD